MSSAGMQNTALWEDSAAVGGTFRVDWKRRFDLPFSATNHLYNPMNEGKPVRIGRDGQEVPADVGRALCQLFDEGADAAGIPAPTRPAGDARCTSPCGAGCQTCTIIFAGMTSAAARERMG